MIFGVRDDDRTALSSESAAGKRHSVSAAARHRNRVSAGTSSDGAGRLSIDRHIDSTDPFAHVIEVISVQIVVSNTRNKRLRPLLRSKFLRDDLRARVMNRDSSIDPQDHTDTGFLEHGIMNIVPMPGWILHSAHTGRT